MLVLTRKVGEKIVIDSRIVLEVVETRGRRVKLGIVAPLDVSVMRSEVHQLNQERKAC